MSQTIFDLEIVNLPNCFHTASCYSSKVWKHSVLSTNSTTQQYLFSMTRMMNSYLSKTQKC